MYYATDRSETKGSKGVQYGTTRTEIPEGGDSLHYGIVTVSIPPNHETGKLESGTKFLLWKFKDNPSKHVVRGEISLLSKDNLMRSLAQSVLNVDRHEVFVFIHGYNTSFDDAARRTAQLAFDLQLKAVPVMYSWPSAVATPRYETDAANAEWTLPHLRAFLEDIVRTSGATKIHILAHSMGGWVLSHAVERMALTDRKVFYNVILAAPDIDADVFKTQIVPAMSKAARHVTIYASEKDKALRLSKGIHQYARLGQAGVSGSAMTDFDTIDATGVPTDWLGHSYFAASRQVINDLLAVIMNDQTPIERSLKLVGPPSTRYWRLPPPRKAPKR